MYYRWTCSWKEILKFYKRKKKLFYDEKSADYEFLSKLAQACLGGGNSEGSYDKDSGEGLDEISQEQEDLLKAALGDDFNSLYG